MARNRRRGQRSRPGQSIGAMKGWAIGLVSAAGLTFLGWQVFAQLSSRPDLDAQLCPVTGETSITVVLVDLTDPLSTAQKQDFRNNLERVRNSVPKYGRLSLYKVAATQQHLLEPVLDVCNPGDGSDVTEATGNPKAVRERWRTQFSEPIEHAFEVLAEESGADESPILQSVQSVTLTKLQRPDAAGKPRKLIVASDLLQNSGDLNFYRGVPGLEELKRSGTYQAGKVDLRGIDMELWMLTRPAFARLQNTELASLWMRAFAEQGAERVKAYNING